MRIKTTKRLQYKVEERKEKNETRDMSLMSRKEWFLLVFHAYGVVMIVILGA